MFRLVSGPVQGEGLPPRRGHLHRPGVALDQGGHHANQQPADGWRGPEEEGRPLGDGDDDQMGQSSLGEDPGQSHCRLLSGDLLGQENSLISLFPEENFSKSVFHQQGLQFSFYLLKLIFYDGILNIHFLQFELYFLQLLVEPLVLK